MTSIYQLGLTKEKALETRARIENKGYGAFIAEYDPTKFDFENNIIDLEDIVFREEDLPRLLKLDFRDKSK